MNIKPFLRKINYYETDKMGITHHSNYIRFMEEARVDFLEQIGWGFDKLEQSGYSSPVLSVSCQYKESTVFNEAIEIKVTVKSIKGAKFILGYEFKKSDNGRTVLLGETQHCFIGKSGRPVRMKNDMPEFYAALCKLCWDYEIDV